MTDDHSVILCSVDIETTGPSPAVASMLSVGAVAYTPDGPVEYYATLHEVDAQGNVSIPGESGIDMPARDAGEVGPPLRDADTMEWWKKWPEQWALATLNQRPPQQVVPDFADWAEALPGRPVFLAWPVGFDWSFVSFYLWRYAGRNPFGYSPLCLKAYGAGLVGKPEAMLSSREESYFPDDWIITPEFPHHALHDARAQGAMWERMTRPGPSR